jgi:hypothetical protein
MKDFINFAESNMNYADGPRRMPRGETTKVSLDTSMKLRDLLDTAKAAAGDGIYAQRIQKIISELQPRDKVIKQFEIKDKEIAEARKKTYAALGVDGSALDKANTYKLENNKPSKDSTPDTSTSFKVGWENNSLVLNIRCDEPEMNNIVASPNIHDGDYVLILIETPQHSYYKIMVNPDGKLLEGSPNPGWLSLSEVKIEKGDNFWTVNMKIPVVGDAEANSDPYHRMAGEKPTAEYPWYFNIGRQRFAGGKFEAQAFNPTNGTWYQVNKFGRLEIK